jgi:hypothetical protein
MGHLVNIIGQRVGKRRQFWSQNVSFFYNKKMLKKMTILFSYLNLLLKSFSRYLRKIYNIPFANMKHGYNLRGVEGKRNFIISYNIFDYFERFHSFPGRYWRRFAPQHKGILRRRYKGEIKWFKKDKKRGAKISELELQDQFALYLETTKTTLIFPTYPLWIVPKAFKQYEVRKDSNEGPLGKKAIRDTNTNNFIKAQTNVNRDNNPVLEGNGPKVGILKRRKLLGKSKSGKLSWVWRLKLLEKGNFGWKKVRSVCFIKAPNRRNKIQNYHLFVELLRSTKTFLHGFPTRLYSLKRLVSRYLLTKVLMKKMRHRKPKPTWLEMKRHVMGIYPIDELHVLDDYFGGYNGKRYNFNYNQFELYPNPHGKEDDFLRKVVENEFIEGIAELGFAKLALEKLHDYIYIFKQIYKKLVKRNTGVHFRERPFRDKGLKAANMRAVFDKLGLGLSFYVRSFSIKLRLFYKVVSDFWIYIFSCFFSGLFDRIINRYNFTKLTLMFVIHNYMISAESIVNYAVREIKKGFSVRFAMKEVVKGLRILKRRGIFSGYKICFAGKFSRKQVAVYSWKQAGPISMGTVDSSIGFAVREFVAKFGMCAIKLWLQYRKNK